MKLLELLLERPIMTANRVKRQTRRLTPPGGWLLIFLCALLNFGCAGLVSQTTQKQPGTQPPTVSITSPTAGATVSGTIAVTASASSTIGVAGVQFLVDGASAGAAVTTAPYSLTLNTTTLSNGKH